MQVLGEISVVMSQADIRQELETLGVDVKTAVVLEKRKTFSYLPSSPHPHYIYIYTIYALSSASSSSSLVGCICQQRGLTAEEIADEWVAYSAQNSGCPLDVLHVEKFSSVSFFSYDCTARQTHHTPSLPVPQLQSKKNQVTPVTRRSISRTQASSTRMYTKDHLSMLL